MLKLDWSLSVLCRVNSGVRQAVSAVLLFLSSCGYTFQGAETSLPPDIRKIYIPISENSTTVSGLGVRLTEALRDHFDRFGAVEVVDSQSEADAVVRSRIVSIEQETASVTGTDDIAAQFDATIVVGAELRRVNGQVLWRDPAISVSRSYGATTTTVVENSADFLSGALSASDLNQLQAGGSREIARSQEADALSYVTEKVAEMIYDNAVAADF